MRIKAAILISFAMMFIVVAFQNCGKVASSQIEAASLGKLAVPAEKVDQQMIVKMNSVDGHARMAEWAVNHGLSNMNADDPSALAAWNDNYMSLWGWDAPNTPEEMMAQVNGDIGEMVEYAEPNYIYQESATARQLSELTLGQQIFSSVEFNAMVLDLRANLSTLTSDKPRPIVAVLDSGVDITHLAFKGSDAIWYNQDEIGTDENGNDKRFNNRDDGENGGNGYIDDYAGYNFRDKNNDVSDSTGHGTHCAGIVLSSNQNIFDTSVVLPIADSRKSKVLIMPLKFIGPTGGATSDAINAVFYAANNGARVMSNSWGGPSYSRALEDAIAYAYDREIVFVAAAGNSASNNDSTPVYPASYKLPNVISVASTDAADRLSTFSNFGVGSVDIAAPGSSILSTYPRPATSNENDFYAYLSGTSMATPVVSALAGLSIYENRLLKAHQVKQVILDSADNLDSLSEKLAKPARVNPMAAIAVARITPEANSKPVIASRSDASSSSADAGGGGGGCGLVAAASGGKFPPSSGGPHAPLMALLFLPLALAVALRHRQTIYS